MLLTVVLTLDVEKPVEYDRQFFKAIEWSAGDAINAVEVTTVSQRANPESFPVHVSRCPRNSEGYPVWDLFADVRDVWDQIHGEYVTFSHTEFCWGPDRLRRTLEALDRDRPVLALGNLRRASPDPGHTGGREVDDALSSVLSQRWIDAGDFTKLTEWWSECTQHPWLGRKEPGSRWLEDVFFVKREWLEDQRFFEHGGRLPFQDVYEVMGAAIDILSRTQRDPPVIRFQRDVCDLMHFMHNKSWGAYSPAMRDWFVDRREEWEGTTFIRDDLWQRVLNGSNRRSAVRDFRRGPGGTITRWRSAFSRWLQEEKVGA